MKIYNRGKILYIRIDGERKSTGLKDTVQNRKFLQRQFRDKEFFNKFKIRQDVPTVVSMIEDVLSEKEKILKPSTIYTYKSLSKSRIIPYFGKMLIVEMDAEVIHDFYCTFEDKSTLNTCFSLLKIVVEKAIIKKYIIQSPLVVRKPTIKSSYKIKPFSLKEIEYLMDRATNSKIRNFIGLNFYTGMRTGELVGLKWTDIDFNNFTISVSRTVFQGKLQPVKTLSSRRIIDMLPQAEEILKNQQQISGLNKFIFPNHQGVHYYSAVSFRKDWKDLLYRSGMEQRGIYQLRHSFASNMLSNGEELLWVAQMLGHKSPNITLEKYSKYIRKKRDRKTTFLDQNSTLLTQQAF